MFMYNPGHNLLLLVLGVCLCINIFKINNEREGKEKCASGLTIIYDQNVDAVLLHLSCLAVPSSAVSFLFLVWVSSCSFTLYK